MNRTALLLALSAAAAAASCGDGKPPEAPRGPRAYRVAVRTVATRPLSYAVESVGTLEAYDVVTVPARVAGTLESVDFDAGDSVTPDRVLAVVDGRRYALESEQARAALGRSQAAVESAKARTGQARAALEEAETALARRRGLREKNAGWVSEDELSGLETAVARARAGLAEAEAGERVAAAEVEEARTEAALAEKNAADARVRSPLSAVIERRHVTGGQFVREGDPVATLVDTSRLRVRFRVSEAESVRVRPGLRVGFRVAAFPERDFPAEVFHVNATADPVTRMVECLAAVREPEAGLRPGFFATVRASVGREGEAIVIPVEAVLPTEKGFLAFVVEDGRARARVVKLGLHTRDGGVEVISGLAPGEVLATAGALALEEGVAVETIEEAAPAAAPAPGAPPGGEGAAPGGTR
jgi:multidrug efflux system membrane fusion protein